MYSRVTSFLDSQNLIYSRQFGFRKSHSKLHTLTVIVERIRKSLDNGELAVVYLLTSRRPLTFDTVNHQILISKLDHYDTRGPCKNWFKSYLSDRHQFVSIQNSESSLKSIRHGAPKGSVLGPCCSCYTSMICTWQSNFLKPSILQRITISCILQKPLDLSVQKLMLIAGLLLLG